MDAFAPKLIMTGLVLALVLGGLQTGLPGDDRFSLTADAGGSAIVVDGGGGGNYTTIQAAVSAASPGDTVYVWAGTYQENVVVNKALTLVGNGSAATTIDAGSVLAGIVITANWVNVTGFRIVNSTWGGTHYAGIFVHQSHHVTIHDCNLTDNRDGIRLVGSTHNHIHNNTCPDNNVGISLVSGSNANLVEFNDCGEENDYGIYVWDSDNNTVKNNTCEGNQFGVGVLSGSLYNRVLFNVCDGNVHTSASDGHGIVVDSSHHNTISHNRAAWNDHHGIYLNGAHHNDVTDNNCSHDNNGIVLWGSDHNDVSDNDCKHNGDYGIYLYDSSFNDLDGNFCPGNENGIALHTGSVNNTLTDNTCSGNTYNGIVLYQSDYNTLDDNAATGNNIGIRLCMGSDHNAVTDNTCDWNGHAGMVLYLNAHNGLGNNDCRHNELGIVMYGSSHDVAHHNDCSNNDDGVHLYDADWNVFHNNTVSGNAVRGFNVTGSANNTFYHNDIVNNSVQATDSGGNVWDNGLGEGNYWSDYAGLDNGANNRSAGDGIGDTALPHLGLDYYPFVNSSGWTAAGFGVLSAPSFADGNGSFLLTWTPMARAASYRLEEDDSAAFTSPVVIYDGTGLSHMVTGHVEGTFNYRVRGYGPAGTGEWTAPVTVIVDYPPATPAGFGVEALDEGNAVRVFWTEASDEVDHYLIRFRVAEGRSSWTDLPDIPPEATEFNHTGLTDGLTYEYRMASIDARGQMSPFAGPLAATPADVKPPEAPAGLTVLEVTGGSVALGWEAPQDGDVAGFVVYRGGAEAGVYSAVSVVGHNVTHMADEGLQDGHTYYYRVTAVDEVPLESAPSNVAVAKTTGLNHPPVVTASPSDVDIDEDGTDASIDLTDWFTDPDGDLLDFICTGQRRLGVDIGGDGTVLLTPEADWSGEEELTFHASDGTYTAGVTVAVIVHGVPDAPGLPLIASPLDGTLIVEGTAVNLQGSASDPDLPYGDSLELVWTSDLAGELGRGGSVEGVVLPAGTNVVSLLATDSTGNTALSSVTVTVAGKELPPQVVVEYGVKVVAPSSLEVLAGVKTAFALEVTNTGSGTDSFRLEVERTSPLEDIFIDWGDGILEPGETGTYDCYALAQAGAGEAVVEVNLTVWSLGAQKAGLEIFDFSMVRVTVLSVQSGEEGTGGGSDSGAWYEDDANVLVVAGLAAGAVLVATSPWWIVGLLILLGPLLVKLKGDEERRWKDRVYYTIASKPGIHFTAIKGWLGISNGTLVYNLEVMTREGKIYSKREGFNKRYYPVEGPSGKDPEFMDMEERIEEVLRENPGAAQSEIAHLLDESWQKVHYHVLKMEEDGRLRVERIPGGHSSIYLQDGAQENPARGGVES